MLLTWTVKFDMYDLSGSFHSMIYSVNTHDKNGFSQDKEKSLTILIAS